MLHCLCIVQTEQGERLGITHKGIGAVEHYLMARRLMLRYISHSQKKLAFEYFMVVLLVKLAESLETHEPFASFKETRLGKFLIAANHFNKMVKSASASDIQIRKQAFLRDNYQNYKELYDFDMFSLIRKLVELNDKTHPATQLAKRLQYRRMPKIVRLDNLDLSYVKQEIDEFKIDNKDTYQDWQLHFIQTPQRSYSGEDDPIYVLNEYGEATPINNYSEIINAMSDKYEHVAFLSIDNVIAQDEKVLKLINHLQVVPDEELSV
jgi:HD superfamily phosphohydrolase